MSVHTIDCHYLGLPKVAAAYLILEGAEAAFVETNTARAWPHLLASLQEQGRTPEDVRWVFVTHAHLDHAGGAWKVLEACPKATLVAHPRAARHLIDPSKLIASATSVYGAERFGELYGDLQPIPAHRVRIVEDGEILQWGSRKLTVLHTRGHANHHYVLHDPKSDGIFTGDAFGLRYPALQHGGDWIFPSSSPTDFDGPAALESVEWIVNTGAKRAYLTHFGAIEKLSERAASLKQQLHHSTELVLEADKEDLMGAELDDHIHKTVWAWYHEALRTRKLGPKEERFLKLDVDLNAQGLVFAVKKARYKRSLQ